MLSVSLPHEKQHKRMDEITHCYQCANIKFAAVHAIYRLCTFANWLKRSTTKLSAFGLHARTHVHLIVCCSAAIATGCNQYLHNNKLEYVADALFTLQAFILCYAIYRQYYQRIGVYV